MHVITGLNYKKGAISNIVITSYIEIAPCNLLFYLLIFVFKAVIKGIAKIIPPTT